MITKKKIATLLAISCLSIASSSFTDPEAHCLKYVTTALSKVKIPTHLTH
ncbi:hypothetical protein K661_00002 [Piscirickettsia salmonis LF-89 = ATCC VR-1361]|nr:hypothetical protein K661_00002 [Piscirickettsia salmonis LF-89 = ATCC VR-1361]